MSKKEELVLNSAPRSLPWTTKSSLMLGGWVSFSAWIIIGMMFMRFVVHWPEIRFGLDNYADGSITLVENLEDDEIVFSNHFSFYHEGKLHKGITKSIEEEYQKGDEVGIEFQYDNPSNAQIEGHDLWPAEILVPVGFGILALIVIIVRIRKGLLVISMLQKGHLAWAKLLKKEGTGVFLDQHEVFKMTFEYRDLQNQRHRIIVKTHVNEELEDDPEEPVLFEPRNPQNAIMFDQWDLYASWTENGEFEDELRYYGMFNASIPVIALTAFGILILSRLHW